MTDEDVDHITDEHITDEQGGTSGGGQVSEVGAMDPGEAETPISDDQSVAGQPDGESGEVDEGPQGPNARTGGSAG